jgi:hypothetical protein
MDTSSATEIGPRSLMTHIEGVWEQEHETDPGRASDLICERLAEDGASAKEIICDHLGIGTFNPDVVLRAIVADEYARSLSAEDKLIWGAGLTPQTAQCLIALTDCATMADEAADELMAALAQEDFTPLCRKVREQTGLTDAAEAGTAMLALMPALAEMLPTLPNDTCAHNSIAHVLAALAEHYRECLEQSILGENEPEGARMVAENIALMQKVWDDTHETDPAKAAKEIFSRTPEAALLTGTGIDEEFLRVIADAYSGFLAEKQRGTWDHPGPDTNYVGRPR